MTIKFLDSIHMYDDERETTLYVDQLNDQELAITMKADDGDAYELVMHRADAIILADRLRRIATASKNNLRLASDESHPEF